MSNDSLDQSVNLRVRGDLDYKNTAIKFGVIASLVSIILSLIFYFTSVEYASWSRYLSTFVSMLMIFLGVKSIADLNRNKFISFGSLFKAGMLISLILAVISIAYYFIYTNFINTDFLDGLIQVQREQMADKGLSEDDIDSAMEMAQKFSSPIFTVIFSFLTFLVIGAISSVIAAAVYKKEQ
jgi:hypothetical protein